VRQSRPLLVLTALEPAEVEAAALGEVGRLVERMLARRTGWPEINVRLKANEVRVRSDAGSLAIVDLDGRVAAVGRKESSGGKAVAEAVAALDFRPSDAGPGDKASIRVTRVRGLSPRPAELDPALEIVFDTGSTPLPCSLGAGAAEGWTLLGPASRFLGSVEAARQPEGWTYRLRGRFSAVDLGRAFADRFPPHRFSGMAQLTVEDAIFAQGRLRDYRGQLHARDGRYTRSLIESAAKSLGLSSTLRPNDPAEFNYDRLAAELVLDARGLQLRGLLGSNAAIMQDGVGDVLLGSRHQPVSIATLVRILVPGADPRAGAHSTGELLASRLPIPEILPSADGDRIIPVASYPDAEGTQR